MIGKLTGLSSVVDKVVTLGGLFTSDKDKLKWEQAIKETEDKPQLQSMLIDLANAQNGNVFAVRGRAILMYVLGAVVVYDYILRDIVWAINGVDNPPAQITSEALLILARIFGAAA